MNEPSLVSTLAPPRQLPSQGSAQSFIDDGLGALPLLAFHMLGRAALIGAGIKLLGPPQANKAIVHNAIAGSAMIEVFVLGWCLLK